MRHLDTIDASLIGGHCEVSFDACEVPDETVLGDVGEGYRYAQVRLGPGRVTHYIRWLGIARRAHEIALSHAARRQLFRSRLSELEMTQQMIADSEIDIAAARALTLQACWDLDTGGSRSHSTSIAKTFTAEAVWWVVDRSIQLCGALGRSGDVPLSRFLREVRPFRVYDGPSEVHRWSIARRALRHAEGPPADAGRS